MKSVGGMDAIGGGSLAAKIATSSTWPFGNNPCWFSVGSADDTQSPPTGVLGLVRDSRINSVVLMKTLLKSILPVVALVAGTLVSTLHAQPLVNVETVRCG